MKVRHSLLKFPPKNQNLVLLQPSNLKVCRTLHLKKFIDKLKWSRRYNHTKWEFRHSFVGYRENTQVLSSKVSKERYENRFVYYGKCLNCFCFTNVKMTKKLPLIQTWNKNWKFSDISSLRAYLGFTSEKDCKKILVSQTTLMFFSF